MSDRKTAREIVVRLADQYSSCYMDDTAMRIRGIIYAMDSERELLIAYMTGQPNSSDPDKSLYIMRDDAIAAIKRIMGE
jgi:hypothetical protein